MSGINDDEFSHADAVLMVLASTQPDEKRLIRLTTRIARTLTGYNNGERLMALCYSLHQALEDIDPGHTHPERRAGMVAAMMRLIDPVGGSS